MQTNNHKTKGAAAVACSALLDRIIVHETNRFVRVYPGIKYRDMESVDVVREGRRALVLIPKMCIESSDIEQLIEALCMAKVKAENMTATRQTTTSGASSAPLAGGHQCTH